MKLLLSTVVAPSAALEPFDEACRARGLDGIELALEASDVHSLAARVRAARVRVVALRAEQMEDSVVGEFARLSGELAVPLSVPLAAVKDRSLGDLVGPFVEAGGTLSVAFKTNLDQVLALTTLLEELACPSLSLAWDLRPSTEDLGTSGAVLLAAREHLRLVRLYGGGPEQRDQDGRGVGPLLVDLALAGYEHPIVLTPSCSEEIPRWHAWLASRKIAGCGSGHPSGEHELDVRDIEPKDRLGSILGAFRALPPKATLRITLDHDPSCMYYALEESEPAGTFAFRKIGDGPEVWHAEVTKI